MKSDLRFRHIPLFPLNNFLYFTKKALANSLTLSLKTEKIVLIIFQNIFSYTPVMTTDKA